MKHPNFMGRLPVLRISLSYIINTMSTLEGLAQLPSAPAKLSSITSTLVQARAALFDLYGPASIYAPALRVSEQSASSVLWKLEAILKKMGHDDVDIDAFDLILLKSDYNHYKITLLAELGSLNAYFVTQKGSHDTFTLLMSGEAVFPPDLLRKAPEAVYDVREAAKCLAFELPTSCGFHVFRATESVLRRYYDDVTGGNARPKVRSIGVYLNALKQSKLGDEKILFTLKQMNDLYRNPLIHPEAALTTDEAIAILGIARSAVTSMLAELPDASQTTATAAISPGV